MILSDLDRQIFHAWRRRRRGLEKGAPRIAVVGNCQSFGVAYGMKLLLPQAHVDRFSIVSRAMTTIDALVATLRSYDHVFALEFPDGYVRGGGGADLFARLPGVVAIPSVVFYGFHPDTVYALDPTRAGAPIDGPIGPYHSALALFSFLRGHSLEQAESLFADNVFEALGYYDVWAASQAEFLKTAREAGLDLSQEFLAWSRGAPFMYSMNHPRAHVLYDVAHALLKKQGLAPRAPAPFDLVGVDDIVRGDVFPVYPQIAERLGYRGAYMFKRANHDLKLSVGQFYDLPAFLAESFRIYAGLDRARLIDGRVRDWLDTSQTARRLDYLAADNLAARYRG